MFSQTPPSSLCLIRLSAIGDTCHALAVVRRIQDAWPDTRLTWIIGKTEASLMADIADVEFIIFDKRKGRKAYADVRRLLKQRQFDAVLCMHASLRANWLSRSVDSPIRIGYDFARARDLQWLFTNRHIPATKGLHVLDAMQLFATEIGASQSPLRWDVPLSDDHRAFANKHVAPDRRNVLISPCSSNRSRNFRNWSVENYAAIADHVAHRHNAHVLLTGGNSDLEMNYGAEIERRANANITNLIGKTNLKQLLALIAGSDAVLCPDSGPAHMATMVRTPVVGLYATSNPARTGPYLSRDATVNAYPRAVKQFLGKEVADVRWGRRVRNAAAMELIQIDEVKSMIDSIIDI